MKDESSKNLKNLSKDDLIKSLRDTRSKVFQIRVEIANRNFKNIANISKYKKNIARAMTLLNQNKSTTDERK
ncbi:MAG: hypothetical protein Athens101428_12 [Candidatus Berkelbacteria bacterium Athens1014_28]|uniref:Large ribosomal subunit protein uL29 n=1 Tax=Candidatus Berkelbacteria bacterium Athens1014_28 TaxID=2017145 RepID=A0A554LR23_9BACT|nr:MAG: hypothetical protein Athens101428_12 [Candidatus Berkelbacteria bacterium Athens1014_28]